MLLSIIIPVYNTEKYLRNCIDSVYNQNLSLTEFELIIINDGSLDNSLSICKEYQCKYNNIIIHSQPNSGQAVARNWGLDHARGKYIMFIDSDNLLVPNVISTLLESAEQQQTEITLSDIRVYNRDGKSEIKSDYSYYGHVVTGEYAILHGLNFGSVGARIFLRELIENNTIRFISNIKHEDVLFSVIASTFASRLISIDLCTYQYNWNEGSTDRSFDSINKKKSILSDLTIAKEIKIISKKEKVSVLLKCHLTKHANSLIVSVLLNMLSLIKDKLLFNSVFDFSSKHDLLPIRGGTLSWQSSILSVLINILFLIRKYTI